MWLTNVSIRRPFFMLMVISAMLVLGFVSWARMGVDLFPSLDYPVVSVTTVYPGAGPDAVDTLVTRKVEEAIVGMNDIDYVSSSSNESLSSVVIVFTDRAGRDVSIDVERRVNGIRGQLPADIKAPVIGKFDPNAQPIMQLAMSGRRDLGQLQQLADDLVTKRLEAASGVGQVTLIGGRQREIQVQVDQEKLQARGLSILQVNQALGSDNLNVPSGSLAQSGREWTVRLNNQAQTPSDLGAVLVASTPNGPVYLRDVATVVDTYKKETQQQRSNATPAIGITIVKQASANTIATADAVKKEIEALKRELPSDIQLSIASDQSIFTRQSLDDVQQELQLAILLTGLVLLLFLHTFRSTLIVLLAIPTSLISTLAVMYFMGFSLNMMSTMGLTLTVGILVDDSIVVLENIFRHLQAGEDPHDAAVNGRSEIGLAAIAITLVDVVVFTPIAFMDGIVGQYFRQFGLVIATATLFSLFVSFTLTPLLASRWYTRGQSGEIHADGSSRNPLAHFARLWNEGYHRVERAYARVLRGALRFPWLAVGLGLASFVGGILLVTLGILKSEFMPEADGSELAVTVEMPAGTTLDLTDAATRKVEASIMGWPETDRVFTSVGVGGSGFSGSQARFARIQVKLVEKSHRNRTPSQLAAEARTFGSSIPGARVKAVPISMFGAGGSAIQVRIIGEDQKTLSALASRTAEVVRRTPGTSDTSDGGVTGQPELLVSVDRERAADLGLTPGQVASVLRTALAGSTVGTFRPEGTKGWDINVILDPRERARIEQIGDIPIVTPRGASVKLGQVAAVSEASGPTQVNRRDGKRSVVVSAALEGSRALGDVVQEIQAGLDEIEVPAGYTVTQAGEAASQAEAFGQIFAALGLSVLLMYMLMVALFESLLFPFIIMLSLPLAVVGAFGLLALTGNTLNMMSMIGMILLTGLVGKNAILLVDYTNSLRGRGMPRNQALLEAGPTRLRPILMTTAALVLAMLPLALKLGEGSEWRAPMAVTVIGGLITSTLLTLVMIPAAYTIMDDFQGFATGLPARVRRLAGRLRQAPPREGEESAERPRRPVGMPVPVAGSSD